MDETTAWNPFSIILSWSLKKQLYGHKSINKVGFYPSYGLFFEEIKSRSSDNKFVCECDKQDGSHAIKSDNKFVRECDEQDGSHAIKTDLFAQTILHIRIYTVV